ncbi:MAG TPA: GNAT family N-acetyltransferase [Actinopolymorphaceae bacterium]|nr:GNAT family N-acetyltransferase [Actinopolymorphaceae bacterium]
MTDLRIVPVDPHDDASFASWYDTMIAGTGAGRPDPPHWAFPEAQVTYQRPVSIRRQEAFVAMDGLTVVGQGHVDFPLLDNPRLARFDVAVPPAHRGKGVGTALFAHVEKKARAAGRSSLLAELDIPIDVDPDDWPGATFLAKRGFTLRNTELRRQLRLPVDADRLDALAVKAAERATGYGMESWTGPCPDRWAAEYAQLKGMLATEAPTGDVEYEKEHWDEARLREQEAMTDAQGRTAFTTLAIASDGTLAGHTQLGVGRHEPDRAYQWDTLVVPAHRGHRLGLALKVANLRALQDTHPEVRRVNTWNAIQNGPMVRVNEDLGFEVLEACQEWQRDL